MRATISFEADVSRVNDIMRSLVLEESNALQDALIALEKATADHIVEGILEALEHINGVTSQLEQYRQMMVSFERARFETMLPQPSENMEVSSFADVQQAARSMEDFDSFLSRITDSDPEDPGEENNDEPQEG